MRKKAVDQSCSSSEQDVEMEVEDDYDYEALGAKKLGKKIRISSEENDEQIQQEVNDYDSMGSKQDDEHQVQVIGNDCDSNFPIGTNQAQVETLAAKKLGKNEQQIFVVDDDFLAAKKLGKTFLLGSYGKGQVEVGSLRGKVIGLYFAPLHLKSLPSHLRHFYLTLKRAKHDSFEMVYVAQPTPIEDDSYFDTPRWNTKYNHSSVFTSFASTVPWPSVPFHDQNWRSHLSLLYCALPFSSSGLTFIDTSHNQVKILRKNALNFVSIYGPQLYPFTFERQTQVDDQFRQLGKETSIVNILGSDSRDYLIDRYSNKVPISHLEDKDVALYAYTQAGCNQLPYIQQLEEMYDDFKLSGNNSFEIVFINLQHRHGYEDVESFDRALANMPWLALPFGDEKIWNLQYMMVSGNYLFKRDESWVDYPILFIKPKGKSLLDPYGYRVLHYFGIQAYPFTRRAAASVEMIRLKKLSFNSFVSKASKLGIDFASLIRNKNEDETEDVSLSTIIPKEGTGTLLLFASLKNLSEEKLISLMKAYSNQNKSFEVIFVSLDEDTESFLDHFSGLPMMPWFALNKPLKRQEHTKLLESTIGFDIFVRSHFIAFGPDGYLLKVGFIAKSFENCDFPFIDDAEYTDHLTHCIISRYGWNAEADGNYTYYGNDGWWRRCLE